MVVDIPASCRGMRLDQALARLLPEHSRSRHSHLDRRGPRVARGRERRSNTTHGRRRAHRRAAARRSAREPVCAAVDPPGDRVRGRRDHRHRQAGGPRGSPGQRQLGWHAGQRLAAPCARARRGSSRGHRAPPRQGYERAARRREDDRSRRPRWCGNCRRAACIANTWRSSRATSRAAARRRADRAASGEAHIDGGRRRAANRRSRATKCASASATARFSPAGSKPAARTRFAFTSHRSGIRSSAIPRTDARAAKRIAFGRQALHAWKLGLVHPSTHRARCNWEAPLPADFADVACDACARGGRDQMSDRRLARTIRRGSDSTGSSPTGPRRPTCTHCRPRATSGTGARSIFRHAQSRRRARATRTAPLRPARTVVAGPGARRDDRVG